MRSCAELQRKGGSGLSGTHQAVAFTAKLHCAPVGQIIRFPHPVAGLLEALVQPSPRDQELFAHSQHFLSLPLPVPRNIAVFRQISEQARLDTSLRASRGVRQWRLRVAHAVFRIRRV
jgi:hypothetical protein